MDRAGLDSVKKEALFPMQLSVDKRAIMGWYTIHYYIVCMHGKAGMTRTKRIL